MRRSYIAALVALFVFASTFLTDVPPPVQASGADASLVLAALHVLDTDYFKPIDATRLLNAAIAALRRATNQGADVLPDIPDGTQEAQATGMFQKEFAQAKQAGPISEADLAYTATREMLDSLNDSHVYYLNPISFKMRQDEYAGKLHYDGIGIMLNRKREAEANVFYVGSVFPGSPAAAAGLRRLDRIVALDGSPIPTTAVSDDVADQIRGPAGSSVTLTIQRGDRTLTVPVTRGPVQSPTVEARTIQPGVVYVRLYSFSKGVGAQMRSVLKPLVTQGSPRAVILDLRGNGGGLLREAESVAGIFLSSQTMLVRVLRHTGGEGTLVAMDDRMLPSVPLTVLVDRFTASSAEVVSEGLKNAHRATIVGEKTAGELGWSRDVPLPTGGMFVTVNQVIGPNYEQIEHVGITPDIPVELSVADMERGVDTQLDAALKAVGGVILSRLIAA